jgi:hypothetical protein
MRKKTVTMEADWSDVPANQWRAGPQEVRRGGEGCFPRNFGGSMEFPKSFWDIAIGLEAKTQENK